MLSILFLSNRENKWQNWLCLESLIRKVIHRVKKLKAREKGKKIKKQKEEEERLKERKNQRVKREANAEKRREVKEMVLVFLDF
jgi:hypothetical protein